MGSHIKSEKYDVSLGNFGARLEVARRQNDANVAIVEHTLPPHTLAAPLHRHSNEDEISYVLEGELTVLADEEQTTVSTDESVVKHRAVWHTFWNASDEPLRFLEIIAPGEFSEYFEEIAELGYPDPTDDEWVSQYMEICERYDLEVELESVPRLLEKHGLQI